MRDRLIVGLGNPGAEYSETRHNVGFMVVDEIARRVDARFESEETTGRWLKAMAQAARTYDLAWASHRGRRFGLVKPLEFMNRSGGPVRRVLDKFRIPPEDVLVVCDDVNLPLGAVRLRPSGGAGGHNGIQDILDSLYSANLPRMRVGVGDNFARGRQSRYVLSPFDPSELPTVEETIQFACDAALTFVLEGINAAMNRFNRRRSPTEE